MSEGIYGAQAVRHSMAHTKKTKRYLGSQTKTFGSPDLPDFRADLLSDRDSIHLPKN